MKTVKTLFITHRGERHQQDALAAAPPELEIIMRRSPSKDDIMALLPGVEFLISERSGEIDADMIAAGTDLRLIQRLGSQTWDIDLASAQRAGIAVSYWPVYSSIMVAEHMLLQILALAKRLREMIAITNAAGEWGQPPRRSDEDTFAYNWSHRVGVRGIFKSTVGIVGFGEIGLELARRLRPFECTVLYNKRSPLPSQAEADLGIAYAGLDELLARSDTVCMLLPYFAETEGIVNDAFLARMKPGALLVSAGGSGILDEAAVARAYAAGHVAGFATDTFEWEPVHPGSPLLPVARLQDANVVLTPHTAAGTQPVGPTGRLDDYTNLLNLIYGRPLEFRMV
jgi:phosphoglycerate dehydrogenase-like enzyme